MPQLLALREKLRIELRQTQLFDSPSRLQTTRYDITRITAEIKNRHAVPHHH